MLDGRPILHRVTKFERFLEGTYILVSLKY